MVEADKFLDHSRIAVTLHRAIFYNLPLLQDNTIPSCQLRLHRSSPFSTQQKSSAVFFVHPSVNSTSVQNEHVTTQHTFIDPENLRVF